MTGKTPKKRLDHLLVELELAENGTRAQALIREGVVFVNGQRIDKPGTRIDPASVIQVPTGTPDVGRGAEKLRKALDRFSFNITGRLAADLGASTGGFTQVLLEKGARRVETFDVGYGLLHERLRSDPRVAIHDRTNVRHLTGDEMEPAEIVVLDLSFISLELVLPAAFRISAPDADFIALVKPQFEAGKRFVGKGGIVRKPEIQKKVLQDHLEHLEANGFACWGLVPSSVKGRKGNQEFFSWFRKLEGYGKPLENIEAVLRSLR